MTGLAKQIIPTSSHFHNCQWFQKYVIILITWENVSYVRIYKLTEAGNKNFADVAEQKYKNIDQHETHIFQFNKHF